MKTTKEEREAARLYAAHNTTRYNLLGILDDLDSQASEIERLRAALELLVLDVSEYEAFERPCYALDKARDAISKAAAIVGE